MCLYVQHTEIKSFLSKYILFLFLKNSPDYENFILVKNENLDNRKDTRDSFNNIFLLKNETTKKFKIVIFFYYRKKQLEKFIKDNAIDNYFDINFYYIGEHGYSRKKFIYDGITITIEPFDTETAHAINHLTIYTLFDEVKENINNSLFKKIMSDYTEKNQPIKNREGKIYYKYKGSNGTYVQELIDGYFTYVSPTKFNDPFDCDLSLISLIYYFPISSSTFNKYCSNNSIFKYCESYIGLHNLQYNISSDIEFKFVVFNYKDEFRVLCLTPIMDNIPMWGYYANSHDGVCVGHTLSDYISVTKNNYNGLIIYGDINYSPIRPKYIVFHSMLNNIYLIIQIIKNCFTKYIGWKGEKEFRILTCINGFSKNLINSPQGNDYINLKGTTSELYLGVNYTYNHVLPPFAKQLKKDIYKYKLNV